MYHSPASQHSSVVAVAARASVIHKVVRSHPDLATILTQHLLLSACVLHWHLAPLTRQQTVKHLEVHAHVSNALAADRARVRVAGVLCKAAAVQKVSTWQLLDWGGRIKEILMTHRAVTLHGTLPAGNSKEHKGVGEVCQ